MTYARITGTGSYLPKHIMTNHDWEKLVDTSHDWIVERTGIEQRHIADDTETSSMMGTEAAKKALEAANLSAQDLDLIICATCTPDQWFPSAAVSIQKALGITSDIPAFDVGAACAGFMYALATANNFIRAGQARHVLVVGAEMMSRTLDWTDRNTCVLFGDGAGAVVLEASNEPGILSTKLHAQGQYSDLLYYPNAQIAPEDKREDKYLRMQGQEVFKLAVRGLSDIVEDLTAEPHGPAIKIDWLVPHQANLRIIRAIAKKCGLPMGHVIVTVDKHGNTSSASIPLALDIGIRDGRIQPGQVVLLEGFGGGMAWGGALIKM
jgi:3-oxoacyl-[acyl-carrier-protein] synthase III